ncbi:mitochondrial carrier [Coprinopsis marcescibilis]|uniref:Mitochondrial carrier n=1 Tax=Coprinopsis marcescibilis TaxID=230819 RepID=A0A5C3L9P2_COPMA|nr:mitochondrial carrier [Coprinopsis marcescibilis]
MSSSSSQNHHRDPSNQDPGNSKVNQPQPHTLVDFQNLEGAENRRRRLYDIWQSLSHPAPPANPSHSKGDVDDHSVTPETAKSLKAIYDHELVGRCKADPSGSKPSPVSWEEFQFYANAKEAELWHIFHDDLDLDGNGHLDRHELNTALKKSGIDLDPATLSDFLAALSSDSDSARITFGNFRDFLILLPRRASPDEMFRFYKVKSYLGDDGRGPARVNMEGDVSLSAEDKPPVTAQHGTPTIHGIHLPQNNRTYDWDEEEEGFYDDDGSVIDHNSLEGHTALKFLFAGGVAGAISRTCTAPFDRLKVFLITRPPELSGTPGGGSNGFKLLSSAMTRIYAEGGVLAFWTGNGLSVAKIFPESAIKFFTYESSKRAFAKYWDKVDDPRDISGVSRFMSGGIGGISSQLSIYPIETLKTQMMSNVGDKRPSMLQSIRHIYALGGVRRFYRGLTVGLLGVFPYSAIDMSTFEALKLAYQRSLGKEEPGVLALLAFGSISGSVGATSVYPLNLVRTRLQASGSPGHPQRYTGVVDVAIKTWETDGWRGFYRGLFPTLAKVVPAVSISYVVYEHTKRRLGV